MVNKEYVSAMCRSLEKNLYTAEKLEKLLSSSLQEAINTLKTSGFGSQDANSIDSLISVEQERLINFIKEYSPKKEYTKLILLKNDYFNANALIRSVKLNLDYKSLIVSEGNYKIDDILDFINTGKTNSDNFSNEFIDAINTAKDIFDKNLQSGIVLDNIFIKARFKEELKLSKKFKKLNLFIKNEIDAKNISTAIRSKSQEYLKNAFIDGGDLTYLELLPLISDGNLSSLYHSKYGYLVKMGLDAVKNGRPMVAFENVVDSFALKEFKKEKYTIEGYDVFYLYVLYKQNEIKNVRMALVGISNNLEIEDIKLRFRENYEG